MIRRSNVSSHAGLLYYWRVHLGLLLGTAVATTALTGALLVGDSMRGSLRDLALERLGQIDYALVAEHFFRSDLTTAPKNLSENPPWAALSHGTSFPRKRESSGGDLNTRDSTPPMGHAPVILLNGSARHATTQSLASGVQIQGIDARFAALFPQDGPALRDALKPTPGQPFPSLVVSASLQRALGLELGDAVLLSLERPSPTYRESLFGRRTTDDLVTTLRAVLTGVLPDSGAGRFGLRPQQHLPLNAYLDLQTLQRALDQQDRVNALLISAPNSQHQDLQRALAQHLTLADHKLDLALHSDYIELTSTRFVLDDSTRAAALASAAALQLKTATFSTYLANAIESNGRQVPYSTVTGLDDPTGLYLADGRAAPPLADDGLYLDAWTAQELAATPGDSISLTYYVVGPHHELRTEQTHFRLQGIVQMRGLAIDPTLTPQYPGLQEEDDITAWDAPFPIDMGQIRPQDEAYWDQYGAAPKAFVAANTGRRLWSSRHGTLTAIRFYPSSPTRYQPTSSELVELRTAIRQDLLDRLSPAASGFSLRPVRQEALRASTGATDFSGLFIGFSLFLIAAAALLVVLLCKFGLEQRAREAGAAARHRLPARRGEPPFLRRGHGLGRAGRTTRPSRCPALRLPDAGSACTLCGWRLLARPFLSLHVSWLSLGVGYLSTLLLVSLALWRTVQRFHRLPVRALLAGAPRHLTASPAPSQCRPRRTWSGYSSYLEYPRRYGRRSHGRGAFLRQRHRSPVGAIGPVRAMVACSDIRPPQFHPRLGPPQQHPQTQPQHPLHLPRGLRHLRHSRRWSPSTGRVVRRSGHGRFLTHRRSGDSLAPRPQQCGRTSLRVGVVNRIGRRALLPLPRPARRRRELPQPLPTPDPARPRRTSRVHPTRRFALPADAPPDARRAHQSLAIAPARFGAGHRPGHRRL